MAERGSPGSSGRCERRPGRHVRIGRWTDVSAAPLGTYGARLRRCRAERVTVAKQLADDAVARGVKESKARFGDWIDAQAVVG
eukprot:6182860-Pyramimonas_sp.AAC.1